MAAKAAEASTMMTKTTLANNQHCGVSKLSWTDQRVRFPSSWACSKDGRSGTTVGKLVAEASLVDVGTKREVVLFLRISTGSIMVACVDVDVCRSSLSKVSGMGMCGV